MTARFDVSQLEACRETMRLRQALHEAAIERRICSAEAVAKQAAEYLKQAFSLDRVWLFGSLAEAQWFTLTSDIDLAISQLAADDYLNALSKLQDISSEFEIDLVQLDCCDPTFKATILAEGRLL